MTYTSNTTKEGVISDLYPTYFALFNGRSGLKILATDAQLKELCKLPKDTRIRCKIKQLKDMDKGRITVLSNTLISFTVKTNKSFTDALKTT